jgi:hypothetical protein
VPIVPAAVVGTDRLRRLTRWRVAYGPPLPTGELAGLEPKQTAEAITGRLTAEIDRLEASVS